MVESKYVSAWSVRSDSRQGHQGWSDVRREKGRVSERIARIARRFGFWRWSETTAAAYLPVFKRSSCSCRCVIGDAEMGLARGVGIWYCSFWIAAGPARMMGVVIYRLIVERGWKRGQCGCLALKLFESLHLTMIPLRYGLIDQETLSFPRLHDTNTALPAVVSRRLSVVER